MNGILSPKVLNLLVFNLTVVALLTLVFFVSKNLLKIYLEKRHKVIGYKFKTKIVAIFVVITLIPSALLFIIAGGFISTYIDQWLSPQVRVPIENAYKIATILYEREKERTLQEARRVLNGGSPPAKFKATKIRTLSGDASETIRNAFKGKEGTEVISTPEGDIIRAVVPVTKGGKVRGVLVVEQVLPVDIVIQAETIRKAHEDFFTLYQWKFPLKVNYLLALGFFTLLIVFTALWVSIKIAGNITDPIQKLASATETVSKGNLDVTVDLKRDDEIGLLIDSFNRMVRDLKESKASLHNAYLDADRRRVCLENIVENIDSGVISLDEKRRVITINTTASRILNIDPLEVIGKEYTRLLKFIESEELKSFIKEIRLWEFTSAQRQFKVSIGGKNLTLRVFITQLKDRDNKSLGVLVVFEDITDILQAQQALAWQEVARRIAHEIKNPLTPIKLSTERMLRKWKKRDSGFGAIIENSSRTIIREVEGLQNMVNEFSRLGRMPRIKKAPSDLEALIKEALSIYHDMGYRITFSSMGHLPETDLDREQFRRALINLIDNAIAATAGGGEVSISVSFHSQSNTVKIDVKDTGTGISAEEKDRLFQPYFSTKKDGTGLGLAIVHRIITEHGGKITVHDNNPRGTVFSIEIPVKRV